MSFPCQVSDCAGSRADVPSFSRDKATLYEVVFIGPSSVGRSVTSYFFGPNGSQLYRVYGLVSFTFSIHEVEVVEMENFES